MTRQRQPKHKAAKNPAPDNSQSSTAPAEAEERKPGPYFIKIADVSVTSVTESR